MSSLKRCANPCCSELFAGPYAQRYHSPACRQKAYRLRRLYLIQKTIEADKTRRAICPVCGQEFWWSTGRPRKYDTNACKQKAYKLSRSNSLPVEDMGF